MMPVVSLRPWCSEYASDPSIVVHHHHPVCVDQSQDEEVDGDDEAVKKFKA